MDGGPARESLVPPVDAELIWHPEAIRPAQARALLSIGRALTGREFYLAGGTAVALHLGHRRSVDLDWFTAERIEDPLRLAGDLRGAGLDFAPLETSLGTLHGAISGVRVSFLAYPYPLLQPPVPLHNSECLVASLDDLSCMKLAAIAQRGAKRDFVDLYALGREHVPLGAMLELYQRKYGIADTAHVLIALSYFDNADREGLPRMLWDANWRTIKATIRTWVKDLAR